MACIDPNRRGQDRDNWQWIRDAGTNRLVVGTQARILYADAEGRTAIAREFNRMVRDGAIGPVMMGRDHHDTGGTDSPYRETANIYDGSNTVADMAHQCWAGNAARGMTMAVTQAVAEGSRAIICASTGNTSAAAASSTTSASAWRGTASASWSSSTAMGATVRQAALPQIAQQGGHFRQGQLGIKLKCTCLQIQVEAVINDVIKKQVAIIQ